MQRKTASYAIGVTGKNTIFSASLKTRQSTTWRFLQLHSLLYREPEPSAIRITAIVLPCNTN